LRIFFFEFNEPSYYENEGITYNNLKKNTLSDIDVKNNNENPGLQGGILSSAEKNPRDDMDLPKTFLNFFESKKVNNKIKRIKELDEYNFAYFNDLENALKKAIYYGTKTSCLSDYQRKLFKKNSNRLAYQFNLNLFLKTGTGPCGEIPGFNSLIAPHDLIIYVLPWPEDGMTRCGCIESVIFHELMHLFVTGMRNECQTYACTKDCFSCAMEMPDDIRDINGKIIATCRKKDDEGLFPLFLLYG